MSRIFLVEMTVYDFDIAGTRVLRYCTGSGFITSALDTPALALYEPRLRAPARLRMTPENGVVSAEGECVLVNTDRGLDPLYAYAYDGQQFRMLVGDPDEASGGFPYNNFKEVINCVMEQPTDFSETVTIKLRASTYSLDQLIQTNLYGGTGGLDGTADLKGKTKPFIFGMVSNIKPRLIDPTKLIYQLSDHRPNPFGGTDVLIPTYSFFYDRGVAIASGGNYVSVADMNTTAPAAGQQRVLYDKDSGGTGMYIRLGSLPVGEFTADVVMSVFGSAYSFEDWQSLPPLSYFGVTGVGVASTADALPNVNGLGYNSTVGMYIEDPVTARELLVEWLKLVRGWLVAHPRNGLTTDRSFGYRFFRDPATATPNSFQSVELGLGVTPYLTLDGNSETNPGNIFKFRRIAATDKSLGIPSWRVLIKYARVFDVQTSDLAAGVTAARRNYIANEYRDVSAADATVKTAFPLANDDEIVSVLCDETMNGNPAAPPSAEATRQLNLFKVRRDFFEARFAVSDVVNASQVVVGDVMTVQNYPRFGCTVSRKFLVMGIEVDFAMGAVDVLLWG